MKTIIKPLLLFLTGAGLMLTFQLLTHCNKDDDFLKNSISASELKPDIDFKAVEKSINKVEDACKNGDKQALNELTFGETLELTNTGFVNDYSAEELAAIGKALKKAKRKVVTPTYAEYVYTIDGVDYSFTMTLDEDGVWKLVRF